MPTPKIPCPTCSRMMKATSLQCRACKPTYVRTDETRRKLSAALKGKPKPHLKGRKRPEHAEVMRAYWTPERREKKRLEMLKGNPRARYHGLSARGAKRLVEAAGRCARCGHNGSESRLDVHHIDRDKRNQDSLNIEILCHACHMAEHAASGETGWHAYHRSRRAP